MDKITITRLPENKFKAEVSSYPSNVISGVGDTASSAVSNLLETIVIVSEKYTSIPEEHLTYEGKKLLELAISSRKEFDLDYLAQEKLDAEMVANELHGV